MKSYQAFVKVILGTVLLVESSVMVAYASVSVPRHY